MRKFFLIIFSILLLSSCLTTKEVYESSGPAFSEIDSSKILGVYINKSETVTNDESGIQTNYLWDKLRKHPHFGNESKKYPPYATVLIKKGKKRALSAYLMNQGKVIEKIDIKGKYRDNYFKLKKRTLFVPIPFFFYVHFERNVLIGKRESEDLVVKEGEYRYAWILMHGGGEWVKESSFKKTKL